MRRLQLESTDDLIDELAARHAVMFLCGWKGTGSVKISPTEETPIRVKGPTIFVESLVVSAMEALMSTQGEEEEEGEEEEGEEEDE